MVMEKITIEQARETIENSFGTIYSKEDVLSLLNRIQAESEPMESIINITPEQYDDLASDVASKITNAIENLDCVRGWDLSINYNEVSVDNLEADENEIQEMVSECINDWVIGIKGKDDDCDC